MYSLICLQNNLLPVLFVFLLLCDNYNINAQITPGNTKMKAPKGDSRITFGRSLTQHI